MQRQAFVSIDVNGTDRVVPRSPVRFSSGRTGPQSGVTLRGGDNATVLSAVLGLTQAEIEDLTRTGVLLQEAAE